MGMLLTCIMHVKGVVPRAPPRPVPGGERAWCWRLPAGGSVAVGCSRRGDAEGCAGVVFSRGAVGVVAAPPLGIVVGEGFPDERPGEVGGVRLRSHVRHGMMLHGSCRVAARSSHDQMIVGGRFTLK